MTRYTYLLRTADANRCSYGGFQYPVKGNVAAPDWDPSPVCGRGLHGLLMGEGEGRLLDWSPDATWQVLRVAVTSVVRIGEGKVKAPRGTVVYSGDRVGATSYLVARGANVATMAGGTATAGNRGTATAGHGGTATAGNRGTATTGEDGTATAGDGGRIQITWYDGSRYRLAVGYVGEDGIEPQVAYQVVEGKLVRVTP